MDPIDFHQKVHQHVLDTPLPTISIELTEDLEQDFSTEYIQGAISSLVPRKSLGLNEFTPRFYKTF